MAVKPELHHEAHLSERPHYASHFELFSLDLTAHFENELLFVLLEFLTAAAAWKQTSEK